MKENNNEIENYESIAISKAARIVFWSAVVLFSAVAIWSFTLGSYYTVSPNKSVIQLRFGKIIALNDEGTHWAIPLIDSLVYIPTNIRQLEITNFVEKKDERKKQELLFPAIDGYLISADENILHSKWKIEYKITNPILYYQNSITPQNISRSDHVLYSGNEKLGKRGPQTLLRNIFRATLIEVTATTPIEQCLNSKTDYIQNVKRVLMKKVNSLENSIGVSIENIALEKLYPPVYTKEAFEDVLNASQEQSALQNDALSYKMQTISKANGKANRIIAISKAEKLRRISTIKSESMYFQEILNKYKVNPASIMISLHNNAINAGFKKVKKQFIIKDAKNSELRILLDNNKNKKDEKK